MRTVVVVGANGWFLLLGCIIATTRIDAWLVSWSIRPFHSNMRYSVQDPLDKRKLSLALSVSESPAPNDVLLEGELPIHSRDAKSHITKIRTNLIGLVSNVERGDAEINLEDGENDLIVVTGESGSGKSLLVARVLELLTGSKPLASLIQKWPLRVEMELCLRGRHLLRAKEIFAELELSMEPINDDNKTTNCKIVVSRTLMKDSTKQGRLKSICRINDQIVTLKTLTSFVSPLIVVVDSASAASALSRPEARMAILDKAVPQSLLQRVSHAAKVYRARRREREKIEQELQSTQLPRSIGSLENGGDRDLMNHFIQELDAFEKRVSRFCQSVGSNNDHPNESTLDKAKEKLMSVTWMENATPRGPTFTSAMYNALCNFRDELSSLESQLNNVNNAILMLGSLSAANSAVTALEKARNFLFDIIPSDEKDSQLVEATERAHELLNNVEIALSACTRYLEEDDQGLFQILEKSRNQIAVSVEDIDEILVEWKSLCRKHGVTVASLPSSHKALKNERDGNMEAQMMLSKAQLKEEVAHSKFRTFCKELSQERKNVAEMLSMAVTERLPSLGMDAFVFRADLNECLDAFSPISFNIIGLDATEFMLLSNNVSDEESNHHRRSGKVSEVASSGEKARVLLAIECAIPGSVGATCCMKTFTDFWQGLPPISVLYDEIDAHVGGRAAVSVANMLFDQSRSCQVIAITHSPSVAAIADKHIVVEKVSEQMQSNASSSDPVRAYVIQGTERRKEVARMASGDLAIDEAEAFADALIREGLRRRDLAK